MKRWQSVFYNLFLITALSVMVGCGSDSNPLSINLFPALLSGGQEVPPVTTTATGTGSFVLNPAEDELSFNITVDGLSGVLQGAGFHNAAAGSNGIEVRDLIVSFNGNTAAGTWTMNPGDTLSPFLVTELKAGRIYVNIHSGTFPNGEIRTQVILTPTGASGFTATLNSAQEVQPPTISTTPTGTGAFTLNAAKTELTFVITVNDLSGVITNAHFHNAAAGISGPDVRTILSDFSGNTATGIWRSTDPEGLTPALVAELMAGNIYVNVHTAANPGGEIRGQVLAN